MIISLTGFMGCGKSSVGKVLSELLGLRFADLDDVIEEREGRKIPEIFASSGEAEFRRMEKEALEDLLGKETQMVLALGGGAVMNPECGKMVHSRTFCIYLKASVETLVEHLDNEAAGRPLLNDKKDAHFGHAGEAQQSRTSALRSRILDLMSRRAATYERTAHLIIDTDGKSVREVAEEIASAVSSYTSSSLS